MITTEQSTKQGVAVVNSSDEVVVTLHVDEDGNLRGPSMAEAASWLESAGQTHEVLAVEVVTGDRIDGKEVVGIGEFPEDGCIVVGFELRGAHGDSGYMERFDREYVTVAA